MKIFMGFPQLIGKAQQGLWEVTAIYQDGRIHSKTYNAFGICEAKRRYLMEFGHVRGEVHAKLIQKTS